MSDLSDFLFSLPTWLVYAAVIASIVTVTVALLALYVYRAWRDAQDAMAEVFAPLPSVTDGFVQMGDELDNVEWLYPERRRVLRVIDGGNGEAA